MRVFAFLPLLFLGRVAFALPVGSRDVAGTGYTCMTGGNCIAPNISRRSSVDSRDVAGGEAQVV